MEKFVAVAQSLYLRTNQMSPFTIIQQSVTMEQCLLLDPASLQAIRGWCTAVHK